MSLPAYVKLCSTFWAEASSIVNRYGTLGAKEVRHREFRATILTEFSRRSHTPAQRTGDCLWIARSAKTCDSCWREWLLRCWCACLRKTCLLLHHVGCYCRWDVSNIEPRSLIILLYLLTLCFKIKFMLLMRSIGFQIGSATRTCAEAKLDIKTARADGTMALRAEVKLVLYLGPGAL